MHLRTLSRYLRHRASTRGRVFVVGAALLSLSGLLIAPVSAATSKTAKPCHSANGIRVTDQGICKGLAFYHGQTINSYNIGSIGGPFDDLAIAEQTYLAAYLGATVNIVSYTTGNTIPGQDALAHAAPDGLSIGLLNPLNDIADILTNVPGISFNPARLAYLAQAGVSGSPLVALAGSGYTTFAQVVAAGQAGTLKILTQNTGTTNTILRTWMGVMGLKPQWITGYSKLADETTGLLRGDGPMADIDLSLSCSILQAGKVIALATNVVPPVGTNCRKYLAAVPTLKQLEAKYPPKTKKLKTQWATLLSLLSITGNPTVTQTSVSGYKINTLRAALKWVYAQPGFRSEMLQFGLNPTYVNPVQAKQSYITALNLGQSVACYVAQTC